MDSRTTDELGLAKTVLTTLIKLFPALRQDRRALEQITAEAWEAAQEKEKGPALRIDIPIAERPLVTPEDGGSFARVLNYNSTLMLANLALSLGMSRTATRTLDEASLSLKGKCLFCDGNLQLEVKDVNGSEKVYLSCRTQSPGKICENNVWEIHNVSRVSRL